MSRQVYAYAVCLVAIIALLFAVPRTLKAWFDYHDPLHVKQPSSDSDVSSFEAFLADVEKRLGSREFYRWQDDHSKDRGWAVYVATRDAWIGKASFEARRDLISNTTLAVIALLLFISHWGMTRKNRTNAEILG